MSDSKVIAVSGTEINDKEKIQFLTTIYNINRCSLMKLNFIIFKLNIGCEIMHSGINKYTNACMIISQMKNN